MLQVVTSLLQVSGLISIVFFGVKAKKHDGEFSNAVILQYSAIFAASITVPILFGLLTSDIATLGANGFPFLLIVIGSTLLIYLHWKFYRYVSNKAEQSGRSYGAFLVLAVIFPLITLLVVSIMKTSNNSSTGNSSESSNPAALDTQLANLQNLRNQGVLTEEEFVRAKAKLIN
jgi:uncharacterized membrane protein